MHVLLVCQVTFDTSKHLSDVTLKRRQQERLKLQELERQREEQKRREKEEEEKRKEDERYGQKDGVRHVSGPKTLSHSAGVCIKSSQIGVSNMFSPHSPASTQSLYRSLLPLKGTRAGTAVISLK